MQKATELRRRAKNGRLSEDSRHTGARMQHVLHHSAAVFADLGFHQAGMRDISKAAGMSLAGLYYYFRSKDELLYLISHRAFDTLLQHLEEPFSRTSDPEELLRIFVNRHLEYFTGNQKEMKVISHEAESLSPEFSRQVAATKRRYYRTLEAIIESLLRRSSGPAPSARLVRSATLSLFGMMNWIYNWYRPDRDGDSHALADLMVGIFLGGLRNLTEQSRTS